MILVVHGSQVAGSILAFPEEPRWRDPGAEAFKEVGWFSSELGQVGGGRFGRPWEVSSAFLRFFAEGASKRARIPDRQLESVGSTLAVEPKGPPRTSEDSWFLVFVLVKS